MISALIVDQTEPRLRAGEQGETSVSKESDTPAVVFAGSRVGRRVVVIVALVAVLLSGALVAGTLPRLRQARKVSAAAAEVAAAPQRVTVTKVEAMAPEAERVLPGNSLPLLEAAIFARTNGYIKSRLVDIGDRVKEGQLLAEISAPDVDAQLAQAEADLELAKDNLPLAEANSNLAQITLKRFIESGPGTGVSLLQLDQQKATVETTAAQVEATKASIKVNEAAVQRFTVMQGFQRIIAPFPGVITARNIDPGDLIAADTPSTTKELFHLMRTDTLRVFVNVPQVFATGIKVDQDAVIYRREDLQTQYPGKVVRTANALDPNTRTLLTEVDVPNPDDALRPGMYVQVKFIFDRHIPPLMIPAAALVVTSTGAQQVAVPDEQNHVQYRTVQLGRDFGAEIEVMAGLKAGETIIVHPGDALAGGTVVQPVELPTTPGP
jgi:RND family efflux transporter MFP subunit